MASTNFYMETATRIYPAVGITIYKDTFYVYEDSNDIWYAIKQGYGRHNRNLFVKASVAHSNKILQYSGLNSINLNTSEDFREDVGTVLTPNSKDIHKYYEALYNIPTTGNVKFLNVYVDMLTVIQVSRLGKHYRSVDVYAIRSKETRELVGYVAASLVNGAVSFKEGSAQRAAYTSNLRKFIGKIRTGDISVFSMRGIWHQGDYVVTGSHYNSPEDSQDNVFAAWSDVFMDSAVAMTAKDEVYVNGPLKFISAPEDAILPERPGVIRWPDRYTLRKRKYVIHTTNVYKVGEHIGVFYKAADPRKGTTHFVNANPFCSAYISADVDVKNWITADGVAWTILTDANCPEVDKHRLSMHKKNREKYKNYIVMSTCYVDTSKKYIVQVPLNGNRKPSETMYAYRVHYFNSDEVSYVSEAVTTPNGNARSILYFLDTIKPGHVVSSCKNVHNTADVTIIDATDTAAVPELTSNAVVMEVPAEIVTAPEPVEVATADSVERLYALIVPRLDALGVGQDNLTARVKKLETDLEQLATDEERRGLEIKTALDALAEHRTELLYYVKDNNLALQQLPKLQDQVKLYLDAINHLRSYVDGVHLSVKELILKQAEDNKKLHDYIANTKGSVEAVRTDLNLMQRVLLDTAEYNARHFDKLDTRLQSIHAAVEHVLHAIAEASKGVWSKVKSIFTK